MRKLLAIAAAVILMLVLPTAVLAKASHKGAPHVSGTITAWDEGAKHGTVKDSTGKEHSFGWTDQTTVVGTPKVGEHASVTYTKDKDGKVTATQIHIGEKTTATKSTTK